MAIDIKYRALIDEALTKPGTISECYSMFYNYSLMNGLILQHQMCRAKIPLGPCGSFAFWKKLGGRIKRGSKALVVRVPCIYKKEVKTVVDGEETAEERSILKGYVWKAGVFTYAQIEGIDKPVPVVPEFDYQIAAEKLGVPIIPFESIDGNSQGYCSKDGIAINPLCDHKVRTAVHEMAHYLLEHRKTMNKYANNEVEAELVSYLVGNALNLDGASDSRGYIQHWLKNNTFEESAAAKVITLAGKILSAGKKEAICQ